MKGILLIIPQICFIYLEILGLPNGHMYLRCNRKLKFWKATMVIDNILVVVLFIIFSYSFNLCFIIFAINSFLSALSLEILSLIEKKYYFALLSERINKIDNVEKFSIHDIKIKLIERFDAVYQDEEIKKVLKLH